ncbi:MAG: export transporter periplasmic protein LptC [Pseudomonadota bacterium]
MGIMAQVLKFLPMLLMAFLTLGTYWMVQMNEPNLDTAKQKRHVPDYIMDGIVVTTLGPQGNTKFRVVGQKLTHYEDDASSEIDWPIARRFHETKPAITVKSDKGFLDGDMTVLDLVGNASLTRPAQAATATQAGSARLLMSSSKFTVLMNDDIVKTNRPVNLEQGQSIMTSQEGAIFDNVHQKLTMIGQVKGRIESESKGNAP